MYLDSQMIFPIVGQRFVELAILLFRYIVGIPCPDRFRFVQFFILKVENNISCVMGSKPFVQAKHTDSNSNGIINIT